MERNWWNLNKDDLLDFEAWTPSRIMKFKIIKGIHKEVKKDNREEKFVSKEDSLISWAISDYVLSEEERNVQNHFKEFNKEIRQQPVLSKLYLELRVNSVVKVF